MKRLNQILVLLMIMTFLPTFTQNSWSQEVNNIHNPEFILRYLLSLDCITPFKNNGLNETVSSTVHVSRSLLRQKSFFLVPRLIEVFIRGPREKSMEDHRRFLENRWERREQFLQTKPQLGLSQKQIKGLNSVKRQDYINKRLARFKLKYRERAAITLMAMGSEKGLSLIQERFNVLRLQQRKTQEDKDLQSAIQNALLRFPEIDFVNRQ